MRKHTLYLSLATRAFVLALYSGLILFQREQLISLVESDVLNLRVGDWMGILVALALGHQLFPSGTNPLGRENLFEAENVKGTPAGNRKKKAQRCATQLFFLWLLSLSLLSGIHWWHRIPPHILVLLALVLWVLDRSCLVFFCPFNTFILRQKCCRACRIHRWDVLFCVMPLLLIPAWSTYLIVLSSLAITLQWERAFSLYPERFFEETNLNMRCPNCTSLCTRKRRNP